MGTYVSISIGNFNFLSYKNTFGDLLLPFSKKDLVIEEAVDDEGETYTRRYFTTTVGKFQNVLDTLGHSVSSAKVEFNKLKNEKLEFIQSCLEDGWGELCKRSYEDVECNFTFDNWYRAVVRYAKLLSTDSFDEQCYDYPKLNEVRKEELSVAEEIVLDSLPFGEGFWGFADVEFDMWSIFRVLLDAFTLDEPVVLDYTELFESGWCDEYPAEEEYNVPKTIILTEGKFDAEVISKSMNLLFPYMTKFFSFINFSEYKVQGSTNFLTHYLKAFIASGIQNRVIAIYDNDSAGLAELVDVLKLKIPDNFKIIHLPNLEFAKNYPTIGPNGKEFMDINGKACSIELFLGQDVLRENGDFVPVHWKGFIEKTKTYQGEVMNKSIIQARFEAKYKAAIEKGEMCLSDIAWSELTQLLKCIFNAFI